MDTNTDQKKCPAYGQICKACHKKNHYAKKCMTRAQTEKQRRIHGIDKGDEMFLGTIEMETELYQISDEVKKKELQNGVQQWTETLKVNNQKLIVKLDTGADCNVISVRDLDALKVDRSDIRKSGCSLVTYSGHKMSPLGQQRLECQYKDKLYTFEFQVIEQNTCAILGRESCNTLGVIKRMYEITRDTSKDILS